MGVSLRSRCMTGIGLALLGAISGKASAATIYADNFTGSSTTNLDGTTPAIDNYPGTPAWSANTSIFKDDGSVISSGTSGSAALPFVPAAGNIYTLTTIINTTAGGSDWIALGFEQSANTGNPFNSANNGYGTLLVRATRGTGQGQTFAGPQTNNSANVDTPTGADTVSVVLDTTGAAYKVTWFENGSQVNSFTYTTNPTIGFASISKINTALGTVSSFSLTSTPEPAGLGLLSLGCLGLLARRRTA